MAAGILSAFRARALGYYNSENIFDTPPSFSVTTTGGVIGYSSGFSGLPLNYVDKVYAHDVTVTLDNYSQAIHVGTVVDSAATTVTIQGLSAGRIYRLGCIRFDASNQPVDIGKEEVLITPKNLIDVTPAELSKQIDWNTENVDEWLQTSSYPSENATLFYTLQKLNDAVMGSFIKTAYRETQYALSQIFQYEGQEVPVIFNMASYEGVKGLSPRHDWQIDIPIRVAAFTDGPNYYQDGQTGGVYQIETGVASGDQCDMAVNHNYPHGVVGGSLGEEFTSPNWPDATLDHGLPVAGENNPTNVWCTVYPNETSGLPSNIARTGWRMFSRNNAGRQMLWNQLNLFSYQYTAVNRELKIYLNGNLHTVLGGTHAPPVYRKKFPEAHYDFPVRFKMKYQNLGTYESNPASQFIDIGQMRMETSCPMHYAGWSARQAGAQGSQFGHYDMYHGFNIHDPAAHSMHNLLLVHNAGYEPARYGSTLHTGYTVPFLPINQYYTDLKQYLWLDDLRPRAWNNNTAPVYSTALHTERTLPVNTPAGTRPAYVIFHGYQQYGTLRARLVDQNGTPIMDYVTVSTVTNAPIISVPVNTATSVRAEVEIQYDGSPINYDTQAEDEVLPSTMEVWRPSTPSLFVGFEVYFADPANIPAMETEPADFAIADAYSASSADNIALTLSRGAFTIANAYSASFASNVTLSQPGSTTWPIKSITGDARTLNKTLRRYVAGTWQ